MLISREKYIKRIESYQEEINTLRKKTSDYERTTHELRLKIFTFESNLTRKKINEDAIDGIEIGDLIILHVPYSEKPDCFGEVKKIYYDPSRGQRFFITTQDNGFYAEYIVHSPKPINKKK